jgi:hypothetical protein
MDSLTYNSTLRNLREDFYEEFICFSAGIRIKYNAKCNHLINKFEISIVSFEFTSSVGKFWYEKFGTPNDLVDFVRETSSKFIFKSKELEVFLASYGDR